MTTVQKKSVEEPASGSTGTRAFYLKTFGCQMNVYDSERMAEALAAAGYVATGNVEAADLVILNTCHIREKAAEKVYSDLGRIRQIKKKREKAGKETIVAVAGCVAQAEGAEIVRRESAVDLVVGPQSYHRIADLLKNTHKTGKPAIETGFSNDEKFDKLPSARQVSSPSQFLTIQEGCDKFCTFCVVPYTRGLEFSRPAAKILQEARQLVHGGVSEITLLGQNVNAYHGENGNGRAVGLGELIELLAQIDGLERIRYMTSHPNDMGDDLIAAHRDVPQLMPFLHLPVQSGSDRILRSMNRRHSIADYLAAIDRVRAARSDMAFSSDFIVGFPGETREDFDATIRLIERVGFAQSFSFKYSPRPGTPAADLKDQLDDSVKSERLQILQDLLYAQQLAFNQAAVGQTVAVLVERKGRESGIFMGKTPHLQLVHVETDAAGLGDVVPVRIGAARQNSLLGRALGQAEAVTRLA